jgi:hypothetical protein
VIAAIVITSTGLCPIMSKTFAQGEDAAKQWAKYPTALRGH